MLLYHVSSKKPSSSAVAHNNLVLETGSVYTIKLVLYFIAEQISAAFVYIEIGRFKPFQAQV